MRKSIVIVLWSKEYESVIFLRIWWKVLGKIIRNILVYAENFKRLVIIDEEVEKSELFEKYVIRDYSSSFKLLRRLNSRNVLQRFFVILYAFFTDNVISYSLYTRK